MPLTQEIARFIAELSFEKLPAEAVEIARTGFIDTIATMIAGAHDDAPQLLRKALNPPPGESAPTLPPLRGGSLPPPHAGERY